MNKYQLRVETGVMSFWKRYKGKPLGMIGLIIVIIYVFIAIFAPFLTPYSPKQILLADRIAAPLWFRYVIPKYNNAPQTVTIGFDSPLYEIKDMPVSHIIEYNYSAPKTFSLTFDCWVNAPFHSEAGFECLIKTPEGREYSLWGKSYSSDSDKQVVRIDSRDLGLKQRLGLTIFEDPALKIFSSRGDYSLIFRPNPGFGDTSTRLYISNVKLHIPGLVHGILGTDHMGSDLWTQLVYGTRISLVIGLSAAVISVAVGTAIGIICGYLGGVIDEFIMRAVDVFLAIPVLPILIILGAILGKSIWNIVILVSAFAWMNTARLVRSQTLSLRERIFIEAAKASGGSDIYIMSTHILPNVLPLVFASMVLLIPTAILTEASLSFLGFGDPRVATWGRMLHNARGFGAFTTLAWWWLVPPGLAITFLSLAFVFIGNTINEIFNPKYRERL